MYFEDNFRDELPRSMRHKDECARTRFLQCGFRAIQFFQPVTRHSAYLPMANRRQDNRTGHVWLYSQYAAHDFEQKNSLSFPFSSWHTWSGCMCTYRGLNPNPFRAISRWCPSNRQPGVKEKRIQANQMNQSLYSITIKNNSTFSIRNTFFFIHYFVSFIHNRLFWFQIFLLVRLLSFYNLFSMFFFIVFSISKILIWWTLFELK